MEEGKNNRQRNTALMLIFAGLFLLLDKVLNFAMIAALLFIALGIYLIRSRTIPTMKSGREIFQKYTLLTSFKREKEAWVLRNMGIWSLIGEVDLDLSLAIPEQEETTIVLQGALGDVDIIIPDDFGVRVNISVLFGQVDIRSDREAGMLNKIEWQTPDYESRETKVQLFVSYIVGDINVRVL